ncbi:YihY/virulence factor BrkB family protein [Solirubrobacter sp. CPCC 204708]|uniref:YihY/virulence factor BrkB family protein n=1 Tax=Solirubrobacter deserti TaxID=2282478 RepID=A0ABT4RIT6_9ACTN|nr:YihY/virulence factor BrkB family protein [Solirubrobacter deserti]MBE2320845.1 YihY/virulence factor BrkB family protein [Solirubrobacter deserti]MDA0138479.1 YihY/virulence factor BrkB family protein [Solirubrobacter deserti]
MHVLGSALRRFWEQNMFHHAAALTYHALLALFQVILLGVALLGLLGTAGTVDDARRFLVDRGADPDVVGAVTAAGRHAIEARGASAAALAVAVVFALFIASSAYLAATVALNVVVEARDDRNPFRRRAWALFAAGVGILLAVGAVIAVFLGGTLAEETAEVFGLGDTAASAWRFARLPLAAVLAMTGFAWMYYSAPTVDDPRWKWISAGACVAVAVWLVASIGLFRFVAAFGTYNATYGTFATAIILAVWLWLTSAALLLGAEVNAAGRYADDHSHPLSRSGHSPETAQHEAARTEGR